MGTADTLGATGLRAFLREWSLRIALGVAYAVIVLIAVIQPAVRTKAISAGLGLFGLAALVCGVMAATRRALPRAARRAWWLLSGGFLLLNLVPVGLAMAGTLEKTSAEDGILLAPTYGDLIRLLAVLPMLAGLIMFPRSNTTKRDGAKLALDVLTVVGGSFMVVWYFVLGPVVTSDLPVLTLVVAAAYPISDLTLIFGATVVVMRGAHPVMLRPMAILVGGLSLLVLSDSYLGFSKLHPELPTYPRLQLAVLMSGLFLLAFAGAEQYRIARIEQPDGPVRRPSGIGSRVPYVALAAGSGLLIVVAVRSGLYPWTGLIGGGVVMIAAVAGRQFIALRENHYLITRDSLTGLANRVRLNDALALAVERAETTGEPAAVLLIDLDGFKQVNDTLGHDGGDQLLVGFADQLRSSILGSDIVARLGGDEFAIVLHHVGSRENAAAVANRILTAMTYPIAINSEPVFAAASIGIAVTLPGVVESPQELLYRADMAMYAAKSRPGNAYVFSDHDLTAAEAR